MNRNLFVALREAFPADLDSPALETADGPGGSYTWRDLEESSARLANALESLGLPRGARIAVQAEKSPEMLMLYLAVLRAGYVFLPLNTAYQGEEIGYFMRDAEPGVVVCSGRNLTSVSAIAERTAIKHVFSLNDDRTGSLIERAAACDAEHTPADVSAEELAVILYTSGTTGRSKGAMLSHGNLLANAVTLKAYWGWRSDDVLLHALPLFHVHGLFVAAQGALLSGCKMIWFNRFDAEAVLGRMREASVFMGVPTLYVRMLNEPTLTRETCGRMRLFLAGSAPLLPQTFEAWRQRTGHTILERYGMTETVMLSSNPYDGERRAGTVGFALPGIDLRIVDENGRACTAGGGGTGGSSAIGSIEVRGPSVFQGYWRAPELTREAFSADGWFRTGDLGRFDERGYLVIAGRSKDLIISGGLNVYPAEVESHLNDSPGVAESAVIGVPHPDFGEAVVGIVAAQPGTDLDAAELIAGLKARIANFKVPKRIFVVRELPRNVMGKVRKDQLRAQHAALFVA